MKAIVELKDQLPVPWQDTFRVLDSTKIQTFQGCPRQFYFEYVLGWRKEEPNIHLVFGKAWHDAMEHLLNHGYSRESIENAFRKFAITYKEEYPDMLSQWGASAKAPENALDALVQYASHYSSLDKMETLFTEITGVVHIDTDRPLYVKMDSVIRKEDGIYSMEHKTTGRMSEAQQVKWHDILQVGSYTHALYTMFPPEEVRGIIVNLAVLRKKNNDFMRIPVRKNGDDMAQWLFEINYFVDQIIWNFQQLAITKPTDQVMGCFPRNGENCGKFGCKHPGLCQRANPLSFGTEPPIGYKKEFWDPRSREGTNWILKDGKVVANDKSEGLE